LPSDDPPELARLRACSYPSPRTEHLRRNARLRVVPGPMLPLDDTWTVRIFLKGHCEPRARQVVRSPTTCTSSSTIAGPPSGECQLRLKLSKGACAWTAEREEARGGAGPPRFLGGNNVMERESPITRGGIAPFQRSLKLYVLIRTIRVAYRLPQLIRHRLPCW
jgi:hypothetical protein